MRPADRDSGGRAEAVQPATSEFMDVTAGETAPNSPAAAETDANAPGDTGLVSGVSAEPNEQQPHAVSQGWRDIETAPRDGTRILIWFVHAHAKYSDDPIAEGWEAAHEAHWIDHNGGGWTWHGLCGVATYWQPLPAPPSPDAKTGGAE